MEVLVLWLVGLKNTHSLFLSNPRQMFDTFHWTFDCFAIIRWFQRVCSKAPEVNCSSQKNIHIAQPWNLEKMLRMGDFTELQQPQVLLLNSAPRLLLGFLLLLFVWVLDFFWDWRVWSILQDSSVGSMLWLLLWPPVKSERMNIML